MGAAPPFPFTRLRFLPKTMSFLLSCLQLFLRLFLLPPPPLSFPYYDGIHSGGVRWVCSQRRWSSRWTRHGDRSPQRTSAPSPSPPPTPSRSIPIPTHHHHPLPFHKKKTRKPKQVSPKTTKAMARTISKEEEEVRTPLFEGCLRRKRRKRGKKIGAPSCSAVPHPPRHHHSPRCPHYRCSTHGPWRRPRMVRGVGTTRYGFHRCPTFCGMEERGGRKENQEERKGRTHPHQKTHHHLHSSLPPSGSKKRNAQPSRQRRRWCDRRSGRVRWLSNVCRHA